MKTKLMLAVWAAVLVAAMATNAKAVTWTQDCDYTRGRAWFCTTQVLRPVDSGPKILHVKPTDEPEDAWARRCEARKIIGRGLEPDRWHIGNPACR